MNNLQLLWQLAIGGLNTGRGVFTRRRPTGAALRNPKHPAQAARIESAAVKRDVRSHKLDRATLSSVFHNPCTHGNFTNLNPFYIAN